MGLSPWQVEGVKPINEKVPHSRPSWFHRKTYQHISKAQCVDEECDQECMVLEEQA